MTPLRYCILVLFLVAAVSKAVAQIQPIQPPPSTVQAETDKNVRLTTQDGVNSNVNNPTTKVSENVSVKLGPVGELYLVSGLNDFIKVDTSRKKPYFYPSLIFDMSASPVLKQTTTKKEKKKVENTGFDLEWRDVTVTVGALCRKVDQAGAVSEVECNDAIEVLEVLPNKTGSGHKDSLAVQLAGALTDLATASAPFFPASTFNEKVAAGGGGLSVLFRNLFPPETQTYYHAFIGDSRTFGWNFRQDHSTAANTSLLGMNRGIVLFKARKDVTKIRVKALVLSRWNDTLDKDPFNYFTQSGDYELVPEKSNAVDYETLPNLDAFPALIHTGEVLNILHLVDNSLYAQLKSKCDLTASKDLDGVEKKSMVAHLKSLKTPLTSQRYSNEQVEDIMSDFGESISKSEVVKLICRYDLENCPDRGEYKPKLEIPEAIVFLGDYAQRSSIEKYLGIEKKERERGAMR